MFGFLWSKKSTAIVKILIVDDDPNIVQTLRDRLEMDGYLVVTACNGKEGLQKATEDIPDIILLDGQMPVMSGYEMLEDLRKVDECENVTVMMITAGNDIRTIPRIIACGGVDEYIFKPFDFGTLLKKIEGVVKNHHVASRV